MKTQRQVALRLLEKAEAPRLQETGRLGEATVKAGKVTRPITIITPGWGSSGYYSAQVLEAAAKDKVIPAGTHMYLNHMSESEQRDRPEREVEKIAAVLVEDAKWDGKRLHSVAELMGPHAELIEALAPYIGVSIDADATDITIGEAEGRTGRIVEGLAHCFSVDFVTHAGRGGAILLESARPSIVNALAQAHGVKEATVNDTREQLQAQLRDLLGGEGSWVWVRDFDEVSVWFEHETPESCATYQLGYTVADDIVELSGSPTEVRASTTYVPVARPDTAPPTTTKEGTVEITDQEHKELTEKAGRADAAEQRAREAEAELANHRRQEAARGIMATECAKEQGVSFTKLEEAGLLASLPVKDADLDVDAFTKTVADEVAARKGSVTEASGRPRGFGESVPEGESTSTTESAQRTTSPWGRPTEKASA